MSRQLPLSLVPLGRLSVVDDFGCVGGGVSGARSVLASNGNEYIMKGPSLAPGRPDLLYGASNELIAASLARYLELPVLDFCVIEMGGDVFFGSSWMATPTFYPAIDEVLFDKCENKEQVYQLVVFDVWTCNVDRHHQNLIVRRGRRAGGGEHHLLLLNDHGHCVVPPPQTPSTVSGLVSSPPTNYIRLDFIGRAIRDPARLTAAIDRALSVPSHVIESVVRSVPEQLLPAAAQGPVERFLLDRQAQLRMVFEQGRTCFVNRGGGTL